MCPANALRCGCIEVYLARGGDLAEWWVSYACTLRWHTTTRSRHHDKGTTGLMYAMCTARPVGRLYPNYIRWYKLAPLTESSPSRGARQWRFNHLPPKHVPRHWHCPTVSAYQKWHQIGSVAYNG
jgi:hypothetical protein